MQVAVDRLSLSATHARTHTHTHSHTHTSLTLNAWVVQVAVDQLSLSSTRVSFAAASDADDAEFLWDIQVHQERESVLNL